MRTSASPRSAVLCATVTLLVVPLGVLGCGAARDAAPGAGVPAERAFLAAMVEHHVGATEMARVARRRADAPLIIRLAGAIIESHGREILQMDAIHRRLFGAEVAPDGEAPARLGLSARDAALDEAGAVAALERERLFDLAFLDRMTVHQRGAIALAEAALELGADPELRLLAQAILAERRDQLQEMSDFRTARYGAPTSTAATGAGAPAPPVQTTGVGG